MQNTQEASYNQNMNELSTGTNQFSKTTSNANLVVKNEEGTETVGNFRRVFSQILAGCAKNLLMFNVGAILAFKTIIIANIINTTGKLSFTPDEASWFASLQFIGQPVGCLVSALILEPLGRKKAMMLLNIPLFMGWIITAISQSVHLLYLASIISGLGIGFVEAPTITYIGEITEPKVRGIMTSFAEAVIGIATLVVFFMGVYLDWRTIAYICTGIPIITLLAISQVPESPIWLLAKNRIEEAKQALCWLRGWASPEEIQNEFSMLVMYKNNKISKDSSIHEYFNDVNLCNEPYKLSQKLHDKSLNEVNQTSIKSGSLKTNKTYKSIKINKDLFSKVISDLTQPVMLQALFLMLGFFFFNAATGYTAVRSFSVVIFKEIGVSVEPYKANVVSALAVTLGTITLMILVRFTGKRIIVLVSSIGSAITCISLGIYTYQHTGPIVTQSMTPFVIYTAHVYFTGVGLQSIPWLYISEIFPYRGRGLATGITASSTYLFSFFVTKTFYTMTSTISLAGTFILYGVISFIGFIYLYFLLPETEGKTLQEIEEDPRLQKSGP